MALVACPKCSITLEVTENLLGQQVRCATCATVFEARVQEMVPPRGASSDLPATSEEKTERHSDLDDADRTERRQRRWNPEAADEDDDDDCYRRRRRDLEPHRGSTVVAMGALSLVLPFACGILGALIGVGLGIAAAMMGHRDLAKMRGGTMDPDGESSTKTGLILGYVGLGLSVLAFLACGAYVVVLLVVSLSQQS